MASRIRIRKTLNSPPRLSAKHATRALFTAGGTVGGFFIGLGKEAHSQGLSFSPASSSPYSLFLKPQTGIKAAQPLRLISTPTAPETFFERLSSNSTTGIKPVGQAELDQNSETLLPEINIPDFLPWSNIPKQNIKREKVTSGKQVSCYSVGDTTAGVSTVPNDTTADGTPFNNQTIAIAHPSLPFGTPVLVTFGGRKYLAVVNDRGPYEVIQAINGNLIPHKEREADFGLGLMLKIGAGNNCEEIGLLTVGKDIELEFFPGATIQQVQALIAEESLPQRQQICSGKDLLSSLSELLVGPNPPNSLAGSPISGISPPEWLLAQPELTGWPSLGLTHSRFSNGLTLPDYSDPKVTQIQLTQACMKGLLPKLLVEDEELVVPDVTPTGEKLARHLQSILSGEIAPSNPFAAGQGLSLGPISTQGTRQELVTAGKQKRGGNSEHRFPWETRKKEQEYSN